MVQLDRGLVVRRAAEVIAVNMDDSLVMLDPVRGEYYSLEGTGMQIWKMLEQPISVGEICERMCALYSEEVVPVEADALAFLADLRSQGLIKSA